RKLSNQLRMDRAKEYLISTPEGIEQIAFKVGFSNASSFSSAFSREVGRSPLEFRLTNSWGETQ
ncbi:helix-turn-helix domain-containing protein, partial [Oleiphilus sp. HI0086]